MTVQEKVVVYDTTLRDGEQAPGFSMTYIDDCVRGTLMIARGQFPDPINLGSSELVSVDQLVSVVEEIAGIDVIRRYVPGAVGVAGRNSDNTLIVKEYGWEPSTRLRDGLAGTYAWVRDQVRSDVERRAVLL